MTNDTPKLTTVELLEALRNDPAARAAIASLYSKSQNATRDAEIAQRVWAGEKQADIAREYGLSVNRIAQIMSTRKNPNPVKRNPNAERDRLILDAARNKVPRAEIARQHNLSVIRVNQIVGAAPKPKAPTFADRVADAMRKYSNFDDMTIQEECLVMVGRYEPIARRITQDLLDGMGLQQLEDKYPADMTGDIPWTAEHYRQVASIMYNFETGAWRR